MVGLQRCSVEVLSRCLVHRLAALWAWRAVFVLCKEFSALFLVRVAVSALRGGLCSLVLLVVPGGGNFEHVLGALVFTARHDGGLAGVDGDDLGSCCTVLVEEVCTWCGVNDPHGVRAVLTTQSRVNGCLSGCFGDALDVRLVLMVGGLQACERVGDFVVVNGDVARFAVFADVG